MRNIVGYIDEGCVGNLNVILKELDAFATLKVLSEAGLDGLLDSTKFCHKAVIHVTGRANNTVATFKPVWTKDCVRTALVAVQNNRFIHNG